MPFVRKIARAVQMRQAVHPIFELVRTPGAERQRSPYFHVASSVTNLDLWFPPPPATVWEKIILRVKKMSD